MNTILSHLIISLNNIDEKYYSTKEVVLNNGVIEASSNGNIKHYERRFMIEFSVQYSKLFDTDKNKIYNGSQTDFEVPKRYAYHENSNISIRDTYEKLNKKASKTNPNCEIMSSYLTTIPDFLIHKNEENFDQEFQKLIVEAKTNSNPPKIEIYKDLFHINIYAEEYNYQNCVILIINYPKKEWLSDLRGYLANRYYLASKEKQERIFVVFKENFQAEATVNSLVELKRLCQQIL